MRERERCYPVLGSLEGLGTADKVKEQVQLCGVEVVVAMSNYRDQLTLREQDGKHQVLELARTDRIENTLGGLQPA